MDIISGISAISEAAKIVRALKDLDNTLDNVEFKLAIADLTEKLADAKVALSEAKVALNDKEVENRELRGQVEAFAKGDLCRVCKIGRMTVLSVKPHGIFGALGANEETKSCDNPDCNHQFSTMIDTP